MLADLPTSATKRFEMFYVFKAVLAANDLRRILLVWDFPFILSIFAISGYLPKVLETKKMPENSWP